MFSSRIIHPGAFKLFKRSAVYLDDGCIAVALLVEGVKMFDCCGSKKCSTWWPMAILLYFVINFRVEAGIATSFERGLDGLVGGLVLLVLLYIGARFFKLLNPAGKKDPLACCDDSEKK